MRAKDGRRVVTPPAWVRVASETGRASRGSPLSVSCERCGKKEDLSDLVRGDAEQALGRFASWHKRCQDPALIREAVRAAEESIASREEYERLRAARRTGVVIVFKKRDNWGE